MRAVSSANTGSSPTGLDEPLPRLKRLVKFVTFSDEESARGDRSAGDVAGNGLTWWD